MKPRIIVLSSSTNDEFNWLSDGWYQAHQRHTAKAKRLMKIVHDAIEKANSLEEAIQLLRDAGFEVVDENTSLRNFLLIK